LPIAAHERIFVKFVTSTVMTKEATLPVFLNIFKYFSKIN
jgi:hypothetical protein